MSGPRENTGHLRGEGIVCLSSIDWDFIWQGHQEIMFRLAAAGNPVLFIENTGIRAPNLSDLPRLARRLRNWWTGVLGFNERAPNLIVLSPLLLPFPYSPLCRRVNAWLLTRSISRWVDATKRSNSILWTFLPTPIVNDLIAELEPSLVVYYCADDLAASSASAKAIAASEEALFERADLVFATSHAIKARAERSRDSAHFFPFGVDYEKFAAWGPGRVEPPDLAAIPHPRIGYVGGIHRWVDLALIRKAAHAHPEKQFVLVGPEQADASTLKGLANVHLLGTKPHAELPGYISGFDAAIIPYLLTDYTASVYPTKLNEYFAMGVPVVSTALPEVVLYNSRHGEIVHVAPDEDGFVAALGTIAEAGLPERQARKEAARANGWDARVERMSALILSALTARRARPDVLTGVFRRLGPRWRASAFILAGALLTLALVRLTPLPWALASFLTVRASATQSDAAVVFGGGAGESGEIGQGHQERIEHALWLRAQGFAPRLVLCSGEIGSYSESEVMRAIAIARDVPDEDIFIEPKADGTKQMTTSAVRLAREKGWTRVLLVSSPYHMRRAMGVWAKVAPDIQVMPAPTTRSRFYGLDAGRRRSQGPTGASFRQARGLLQEALTLAYYRLKGWI